ncbi:MAG: MBL fold metallo-hydrolase [Phycisphaerales bacterium]|jgi:glyoxylase-like metal-dependent hydrolase (beta-lactamase superfamily II)|nr:MBL fold metallo-hydrolase [Phycisphaerales bacterium]MDP6987075.1 MBL fold metallo-hydrolase [Phycisphaerales bacterium]
MPTITPYVLGDYMTNCHIVTEGGECWVVDCGYEPHSLIAHLQDHDLHPTGVLLTHCHADHIAGLDELRGAIGDVPVLCHAAERGWCEDPMANLSGLAGLPIVVRPPSGTITPGEDIQIGGSSWRVLHTPGHSPGSVCFVHDESGQAIVGDTLFAGSIGRHDFPTSKVEDLRHSVFEVLMQLPDAMDIYPGHGPATTIGHERATNPFVLGGF